jgi:hypothetical protein
MAAPPPPSPPSNPAASRWLTQARHNYSLYRELKGVGRHPDWTVTVLFYTAMSVVEAYLAEKELPTFHRIRSHQDRNDAVAMKLQRIYGHYRVLHNMSTVARYHPEEPEPTAGEIAHGEAGLMKIVAEVRRLGLDVTLS